ncbi:MAG: IS21 family transposase [Planctomycetes bacterium]|nr:IS21 family transposase [Planctomycetota bacterium]
MANQLAMDKVQAVKHLAQSGFSERRIAEQLGISRKAVRHHLGRNRPKDTKAPTGSTCSKDTKAPTGSDSHKAITSEAPSGASNRPISSSQCEPFREAILDMLERGLTAQRIYQDLQSEFGFVAKYHSVRRYVARLSESTEPPFRRLECEPGTQMQVDFGTGARCKNHEGKLIKTYVFRAILSHSRKGYSEAVTQMTVERFIQVLENAFWRLGGVPKVVIFDNGSCAVKHADWYDAELHPKINDFCKHYQFALVPTRPRTPRHKGKIERGIGYVKNNALKSKVFESLAAQNEHLDHWESSVADTRIHGTTKKHVGQVFQQIERAALQPLPQSRFPFYEEGRRRVSRDGHVAVKHSFYSAPPEYLGREVWVRWNSKILRILNDRMEVIATHCTRERGRFSTLDEHIVPEKIHGIEKGLQYLLRKVRFLGASATRWAELLIEERGVQAARSLQGLLSLSKKFSCDDMNRACDLAWRSKATNYRAIKRILENRCADSQLTLDFIEEHPIIRPVSEYGQFIQRAIQGS